MKLTPFGLCIRQLRLALGMSMKAMADELSVSSAYLSAVELGEKALTPKLGDQVVDLLSKRLNADQIAQLTTAIRTSLNVVPVSDLESDGRNLVAAFARRLTEGHGLPPDVRAWIEGRCDDSKHS